MLKPKYHKKLFPQQDDDDLNRGYPGRSFGTDISTNVAPSILSKNRRGVLVKNSRDNASTVQPRLLNTSATVTSSGAIALCNSSREDGNVAADATGTAAFNFGSPNCVRKGFSTLTIEPTLPQLRPLRQLVESITHAALSYQHNGPCDDIDEQQKDNPLMAPVYAQDIYSTLRERELLSAVLPTYMRSQPHVNVEMRAILVDWLAEVVDRYTSMGDTIVIETLYLAINLVDRYLEKAVVKGSKLQLVGIVCLWIASKYENLFPPNRGELESMCDQQYTGREILDMETAILETLEYQVTVPTALDFAGRYLRASHADDKVTFMTCYLLESSLSHYSLLRYRPSELASAAIMISRRTVSDRNVWSPTLLKYTQYSAEDIAPVARALLEAKEAEKKSGGFWRDLKAIRRKYASSRRKFVSTIPLPSLDDLLG